MEDIKRPSPSSSQLRAFQLRAFSPQAYRLHIKVFPALNPDVIAAM